jgi:hypothetical protein
MEEGTQAAWLVEILSPHVAKVVVAHVTESRGQKSDEHDAFGLAERLRAGTVTASVHKKVGSFAMLRQLVKAHQMIVQDTVRVQNRIKGAFSCTRGPRRRQACLRRGGTRGSSSREKGGEKGVQGGWRKGDGKRL